MDNHNVAYICTPIDFGGAEKVSLNFLENVDREKFNICLILLVRPWEEDNFFISKIDKLGYKYHIVPVAKRKLSEGGEYFRVIRCFIEIFTLLKRGDYNLVHTHGYFADILGGISGKLLGVPLLSTCHGFIKNNWKYKLYNFIDILVLKKLFNIIAVSSEIKEYLESRGVNGSKVSVIQNAVSLPQDNSYLEKIVKEKKDLFKIKIGDFIIGFVGRLSEEKGLPVLLEAYAMLEKVYPNLKLLIIGNGPLAASLESFVQGNSLDNKVIFAGFQRDIEEWLPLLDLFVLPSFTEGTPMALLEAMACGVPVIATSVGGIPKVITSEKNGILIDSGNPHKLKVAISKVVDDARLRLDIGTIGRETIQNNYSMGKWIDTMESSYLGAIVAGISHK